MTAPSRELELRRPADVMPARQAETVPAPLNRGARLVLQIFTVLCVLAAVYTAWVAATGNRP